LNSLLVFSLIALTGGTQNVAPQSVNPAGGNQSAATQPAKLSPLGPNFKGSPRPLGALGIGTIKAGHYKPANFEGVIARPGTTYPKKGTVHTNSTVYNPTALVVYDSNGSTGWIGSIYAYQIGNLLSHFGMIVTRHGVESYTAGELSTYSCGFYCGTTYGNKLPAAFISDINNSTIPFCWMGYNLWAVAWNKAQTAWNNTFANNFGFEFSGLDSTSYPSVSYKGQTLTKAANNPVQGDTAIINSSIATVLATCTNGTTTQAYITRGANFWYIADNPLEYVPTNRGDDRYLAFCDILNDIVGIPEPHAKQAALRIEDVSAICPSATLRALADTLYSYNVPYAVCVIPDYMDPLGVYNNGTPLEIQMQTSQQFISDLQYMQSEGAQIIMHGVTHQYSNVPNPVNGVSAADVEFMVVTFDSNGNEIVNGPVPTDTTAWCTARIKSGLAMMKEGGFPRVNGWNTPHYFATPTDYKVFGIEFNFAMDRALTYATDNAANLHYLIQPSPYVYTDEYNNVRVPETLGYCDPSGTSGLVNLPTNMIGYANSLTCVRGAWAGMYYHWFLGTTYLSQLVSGIQAAGYTFINPSASVQ